MRANCIKVVNAIYVLFKLLVVLLSTKKNIVILSDWLEMLHTDARSAQMLSLTIYFHRRCFFFLFPFQRWKKYGKYRLIFMERHCPRMADRKECLVPPPVGYKPPIRWPKSKGKCWYRYILFAILCVHFLIFYFFQ